MSITQPQNGATLSGNSVLAEVGFRSQVCANTFQADLDGTDVTSQFSPQPPANTRPQATFTGLSPGSHTLTVSAETLQYWFLIPFCSRDSDSVTFTVPGPALAFVPAGPLTVNAGSSTTLSVTVPTAPGNAVPVTLAASSGVVTAPASTSIPGGATSSAGFSVTGQVGGSATLTASAAGFTNATVTIAVRPVLASLSVTSGTPGTTFTLTGAGFAAGAVVKFGSTSASTTFVSATQLTATVPSLAAGQSNVTVTVQGQTSTSLSFQVLAPPPPPPPATTLLFRSSASDVQTFAFASGSLSLLDSDSATPQGGLAVVDVAFNGASHVVRTSSGDVQSFALVNNNSLNGVGSAPGTPSGTGASVAAAGNLVVRASDVGLETYLLDAGGVPQRQVQQPVAGTVSATGVAVDLSGSFAVRAHATGIDVYNVSSASAPALVGSAPAMGGQISSVGVGVAFAPGGGVAVRSGPVGIDVYTLAPNGTPTAAGSFTTGVVSSAVNTAVAINAAGSRAVRAHSTGIEVYDLTNPAAPQRIGQRSGGASTTGVGAFVVGTTAFRATNVALEAYDISNPGNIPAPASIAATPSSIGVGLAGR